MPGQNGGTRIAPQPGQGLSEAQELHIRRLLGRAAQLDHEAEQLHALAAECAAAIDQCQELFRAMTEPAVLARAMESECQTLSGTGEAGTALVGLAERAALRVGQGTSSTGDWATRQIAALADARGAALARARRAASLASDRRRKAAAIEARNS
ncbi:MAG: hypothetical protein ACOYNI_04255 [Acidimicrobiia bacterium]